MRPDRLLTIRRLTYEYESCSFKRLNRSEGSVSVKVDSKPLRDVRRETYRIWAIGGVSNYARTSKLLELVVNLLRTILHSIYVY